MLDVMEKKLINYTNKTVQLKYQMAESYIFMHSGYFSSLEDFYIVLVLLVVTPIVFMEIQFQI